MKIKSLKQLESANSRPPVLFIDEKTSSIISWVRDDYEYIIVDYDQ